MTQEELAGALGTHVRTVRNLENRHFAPSPRTVCLFGELEKRYKRTGTAEPKKSSSVWKSESYSAQVRAALVKLGIDEVELRKALPLTAILKETPGGLPEVIGAMRFSNDPGIVSFLKEYDRAHEQDRAIVPWEAFVLKAGVDPSQLLGAIVFALNDLGLTIAKVMAITNHPDTMQARIDNAKRPGGWRDRNAIDTMLGFLPAKGAIFNLPGAQSLGQEGGLPEEIEPNDIDLSDIFPDLVDTQKLLPPE